MTITDPTPDITPDPDPDFTPDPDLVAQAWNDTVGALAPIFEEISWAEDEIKQAQGRHPDQADLLWHAFQLFISSSETLLPTEFVHRAHYAELLDRLAAGQDTRPPTAAEIAVLCSRTSLRTPINDAAVGLYDRAWRRAFPTQPQPFADTREATEGLHGVEIDMLEQDVVRKLTNHNRDRRIPKDQTCDGGHDVGSAGRCRFAADPDPETLF